MPTAYLTKLAKTTGKPMDELERLWDKAKDQAEKAGHGQDYAYITGIFQHMVGIAKTKTQSSNAGLPIIPSRFTIGIEMKTANITDYRLKTDTLAKVIISYTGNFDSQELREFLAAKLDNKAVPVAASFKRVAPGVAVGFIRANKEIRTPSKSELSAYRVVASNILMDNDDKSLWEVKSTATGKYLTRRGQEDLSMLLDATTQHRADVPALRHLAIAKAAKSEVVAFVDAEGDVDHGFALATDDEKVKVLSFSRRVPLTVDYDNVVSITPITIPAQLNKVVAGSLTSEEKKSEKAYYERLFGFDPAYVRELARQIDQGTEL